MNANPANLIAARLSDPEPDARVAVARTKREQERASGLCLEIIQDEPGFLALEPWWDDLLSRSAVRTPFLTWDWVSMWWESCRGQFELAIGVVRDEHNQPQAIAPMVLGSPKNGPRRYLRHITFAGGFGEITSEGMDFLIPSNREDSLAPLLCEVFTRLRNRWDAVLLPMMREESPNLPHIKQALSSACSAINTSSRQASRFVHLPRAWESLEMNHGSNWRSDMRRKWKKMLNNHAGRTLIGGQDLDAGKAFDDLLALHAMRWREDQSDFLRPLSINFHRKLAERWIPCGKMDISLLELDGRPAAATYCFNHDNRAWFYQAGWDATYASISIGKMAIAWGLKRAIARGLREFDFLPGEYEYKQQWSDDALHLVEIEAFNPLSLRALLFRSLRFCKRKGIRFCMAALTLDGEPAGFVMD